MTLDSIAFWTSVLEAAIRLSIPLIILVAGELVSQRSGVMNLGLEGMLAAGAYVGFVVMYSTGSISTACIAAILAGVVIAAIMAGGAIWAGGSQILVGFSIFVMVPAVIAFLHQQEIFETGLLPSQAIIAIPILSGIPLIGRALFAQNLFWYIALALCALTWFLLKHTRLGLAITACGHDPHVAENKGILVKKVRTFATLFCGGCAGLAGASLSIGMLGQFTPGLTEGRGFIALAVVILGRWRLGGVVIAAIAVGFADASRLRLASQIHVSGQLMAMLPWLVVLFLLVAGSRFAGAPRALS